jgi:hypothetical protein
VTSGSVVTETAGGGMEHGIRECSAARPDVNSQYGPVDVSPDPMGDPGQSDQLVEVRTHTACGDIVIRRS